MTKQYLDKEGVKALWSKICDNDNILNEKIEELKWKIEQIEDTEELIEINEKINSNLKAIEDLKEKIESLETGEIDQEVLKAKIEEAIENSFEPINIESLNLTWDID